MIEVTQTAKHRRASCCRVEGDAVFCLHCDGSGVTTESRPWDRMFPLVPVKCHRCGGEGLEPVDGR